SCHLTPWRRWKVSPVLSSSHDHSLARSGTIVLMLVCALCWSYMTRLLKTPIIGPWPAMVASSWIDMLAGLSKKYIFSTPPCFSARAGRARGIAARAQPIVVIQLALRMCFASSSHRPDLLTMPVAESLAHLVWRFAGPQRYL